MTSAAGRRTGVLADWNPERGFGFLESGGTRTFVHISAFDTSAGRPQSGDFVEFGLGSGPDGRPCAVGAARVFPLQAPTRSPRGAVARERRGRVQWLPVGILVAFVAFVSVAIHMLGVSAWVAVFYTVISLLTFMDYLADKRAAVAGTMRTRERALQVAALLGGWPGGVLAQQFLRHKNRKPSFQLMFWLAAAVNVAAFVTLTVSWPHLARLLG